MTTRAEYIAAVTKETQRRQEILDTIDDYCRTLTEPERIIVQAKLIDGTLPQTILSKLIRLGILIGHEDLQRLTRAVLRPLAAELGIRIKGEPDGNAAEIIAAGRKEYEIKQAEKAAAGRRRTEQTRRTARNPNETRGRPKGAGGLGRFFRNPFSQPTPGEVVSKQDTLSFSRRARRPAQKSTQKQPPERAKQQ